jgi:membrane protein
MMSTAASVGGSQCARQLPHAAKSDAAGQPELTIDGFVGLPGCGSDERHGSTGFGPARLTWRKGVTGVVFLPRAGSGVRDARPRFVSRNLLPNAWRFIEEIADSWLDHHAPRLAAALAYYTLLSIAPLVVIAIALAGFVFGESAARGQIATQLGAVVGEQAAKGIEAVIANAHSPASGILSTALGVAVLLLGSSGVFAELQSTLDTIWDVEPKPGRGVWGTVKDRFVSFTMVLGVAFLLLVSLVVSAALSAAGHFFGSVLPGGEMVWQVVNFFISLGGITVLFALIFKVVPDAEIRWGDVWIGAIVTAVLFSVGKFALGLYLGKSSVTSSYGAAGSLVALAIWVYYAAQILLVGAEFTRVQARRRGTPIRPSPNARAIRTQPA